VLAAPDGPWPEAWAGRAEGGALLGCGAGAPVHPESVARSTGWRAYGNKKKIEKQQYFAEVVTALLASCMWHALVRIAAVASPLIECSTVK